MELTQESITITFWLTSLSNSTEELEYTAVIKGMFYTDFPAQANGTAYTINKCLEEAE